MVSSKNILNQRVAICNLLLAGENRLPFLKQIVTGDERFLHINLNRRSQWLHKNESPQPTPKPNLHAIKVRIWWNSKGIFYYKFLPTNQSNTSEVYSAEMERLDEVSRENEPALINRKDVIFHNDNTQPHTARITEQKLRQMEWEVFLQPACLLFRCYLFQFSFVSRLANFSC